MSLAVPAVYSIPMLMLIGWRGEPGKRDEPQHLTQGKTTPGLLGEFTFTSTNLVITHVKKYTVAAPVAEWLRALIFHYST